MCSLLYYCRGVLTMLSTRILHKTWDNRKYTGSLPSDTSMTKKCPPPFYNDREGGLKYLDNMLSLSKQAQGHTKSYRVIQSHTQSYIAINSHTQSYKFIHSHEKLYRVIQSCTQSVIQSYIAIHSHTQPYIVIYSHTQSLLALHSPT